MEPDLQMFISDKRVKTAEEAAVYADDYVLVRKQFKAKDKGQNRPPPTTNNKTYDSDVSPNSKSTHVTSPSPPGISHAQTPTRTPHKPWTRTFTCTYCHKTGHTVDRCWRKAGVVRPTNFVSCDRAIVTVSEPRKDSRDNSVLPTSKDRVLSEGGKGAVDAVPMSDVTGAVVQSVATDAAAEDCYAPYRSDGLVKLEESQHPVKILRDTGSTITLWVRPKHVELRSKDFVLLRGVGGSLTVPLVECRVSCNLFNGTAQVGVVESLPESNVDLILGNDLVRGEEVSAPVMTNDPVPAEVVEDEDQMNFPVCAVTRSMSRVEESRRVEAAEAVVTPSDPPVEGVDGDGESPDDPSLTNLFSDTSSEQLAL
ncbi:hypothetical protein Pcinc_000804 [Petrolisthes cinctipes]|uniref:Uncharacterized protein n=1 Tax=Petrolisthes cinctipes TaxID=88211 RepID=A0AAE1L542_PETCI|nr:hypothetical protein Pcinc_000804 [Petrolisthes cinctipes]